MWCSGRDGFFFGGFAVRERGRGVCARIKRVCRVDVSKKFGENSVGVYITFWVFIFSSIVDFSLILVRALLKKQNKKKHVGFKDFPH